MKWLDPWRDCTSLKCPKTKTEFLYCALLRAQEFIIFLWLGLFGRTAAIMFTKRGRRISDQSFQYFCPYSHDTFVTWTLSIPCGLFPFRFAKSGFHISFYLVESLSSPGRSLIFLNLNFSTWHHMSFFPHLQGRIGLRGSFLVYRKEFPDLPLGKD